MSGETISVPAEWARQKAIWTAWPADPGEWNGDLATPRADVAALVRALADGNTVRLLVNGAEAEASARAALAGAAEIVPARYGDIWLRDTGPIFARRSDRAGTSEKIALRFATNSWGGKFDLPDDATVGDEIARLAGTPVRRFDFVLEGGAIDHDGEGTVLTTRQTTLNPNRNGWTRPEAEAALATALGAKKIIWIDEGLANDHTDGHIDNIARFAAPGVVVCQAPAGDDDPNAATLDAIAATLEAATDASGAKLNVVRVPGVGRYRNAIGEISPASHMNFIIANGVVVVPVYGTASEDAALGALREVFRGRRVIGVPSRGLLGFGDAGGGSFHCITQQEPA
ncbi:Agmatine deiminase [Rhodomicrobium vannielii ATCC 17100]|uniref:Agmatine deiminase n=1 Tax=Rhodomicrobium vannielii (strain ATCC 17100 / DSM 162 / LMG 4299 / NCIMB 10020 / ATH 3.1.1) TaxID=648757 RepID=E3I0P2_RHOVT|nr:agmatine deiminase family protein [Rhodomicrobium vannielii]ADP70052.1 Agmatine deiminase [Rhodomicrobium vannielii ATCC 17100]